jgi:hypothetical protein
MNRPTMQCSGTTVKRRRCRRPAIPGTEPPRCTIHAAGSQAAESPVGGTTKKPGAPPGNHNAETHGVYRRSPAGDSQPPNGPPADLDARISDLNRRIQQLSDYIDRAQIGTAQDGDCTDTIDVDQYARLLSLHGQLTSRLGRLLRDRQQISPDENSFLQECINEALDQVSDILGVKL